jgi:bifunctional non-homologous end joining protein LigD
LKPLFQRNTPLRESAKDTQKIQRVKPKLVCQMAFAAWTEDGELRQTTLVRWRDDKDPKEVIGEV